MLSVIIPAFNADATLPRTLACLGEGAAAAGIGEIIVADGGSRVSPVSNDPRVRVIRGRSGRGAQLASGAVEASGDWLLFLHADTVPDNGWAEAVAHHMREQHTAAVFRFALDDTALMARLLELIVAWRVRLLALPYGDQGLLISRRLYDEVGGFKPLPLMEDVDMVQRIGRARLTSLDVAAVTSAQRYKQNGYIARMARNLVCLTMWMLGVPPERIAGFYR